MNDEEVILYYTIENDIYKHHTTPPSNEFLYEYVNRKIGRKGNYTVNDHISRITSVAWQHYNHERHDNFDRMPKGFWRRELADKITRIILSLTTQDP